MSEVKSNMTISEVATATEHDEKTLRAYLRRNFKRDNERKGSRWGDASKGYVLNKKQTEALLKHFTKADESEAQAS